MLYGTVTEFCTPQEVRLPPVFRHSRNLIMDGAHRSARLCPRALGEISYMLFIDQDVRPL